MEYNSCGIEKLPEDVLVRILQSLSLIEALATTPVSRKWKNLWEKSCSRHSNLCFDLDNIFGVVDKPVPENKKMHIPDLIYYRKDLMLANSVYHGISNEIIEDFIEGVGMILRCRRGEEQDGVLGVKSLEIRFPLRRKHFRHVNNWISSTVTSITKQLILVFDLPTIPEFSCRESNLYEFPFDVLLNQNNLSLEHLQLEFIFLKLPQNFDGFTTLRTLKLNHTGISQEDVHKLLINCPLLEFLKIQECRNLVALQVSSPLPHLKVLILRHCGKLRRTDLWAENLSSFDYDITASMDHLMLGGCHNLTKVACRIAHYIDGYSFRPIYNDFPFVTTLYLDSELKDLSVVLRDTVFTHLKFLAIFVGVDKDERNLQYLSLLLSVVAPMLEELELHVSKAEIGERYKVNDEKICGGPYNHLKRIAFTGFSGEMGETMLAKYFLMKARRLQTMTIDPLNKYYENFDAMESMVFARVINKECRKAYKLLCREVPENAKLILIGDG